MPFTSAHLPTARLFYRSVVSAGAGSWRCCCSCCSCGCGGGGCSIARCPVSACATSCWMSAACESVELDRRSSQALAGRPAPALPAAARKPGPRPESRLPVAPSARAGEVAVVAAEVRAAQGQGRSPHPCEGAPAPFHPSCFFLGGCALVRVRKGVNL